MRPRLKTDKPNPEPVRVNWKAIEAAAKARGESLADYCWDQPWLGRKVR